MENTIVKLLKIANRDNFPKEDWWERGVNHSPKEIIDQMNTTIKNCINLLILDIEKNEKIDKKSLLGIINDQFAMEFVKYRFDTEERDFIRDIIYEDIANILDINPEDIDM